MKVITFANTKGGSGKSTLLSNLSLCCVKQKQNVVLLDLDPQKTLEFWWEQRQEAEPTLTDIEIGNLKKTLNRMEEKKVDYLLIDTPGHMSESSIEAIKLSDLVIVPCKPTAADLRAVGNTTALIKKENKDFIFVLNQCIPRYSFIKEAMSKLSKFGKIAPCCVTNRVAYANAFRIGTDAASMDKSAASEMEQIYGFLTEILDPNKNYAKKDKRKF